VIMPGPGLQLAQGFDRGGNFSIEKLTLRILQERFQASSIPGAALTAPG